MKSEEITYIILILSVLKSYTYMHDYLCSYIVTYLDNLQALPGVHLIAI